MESKTIDTEQIASDLDHRIEEAVADWTGDFEDWFGYEPADAEAEMADVLEQWLDDRSASDWF